MSERAKAVFALLIVTILWGGTFVWMKQSLTAAAQALGRPGGAAVVCLYVAIRFAIAAAILPLWPRARRGLDARAWRGGAILGILLFTGFLAQMLGLEGVSPPVSAFLTSLYVVVAALISAWMHRTRPHTPFLMGVGLATFGAGFIQGPPQLAFGPAEWLTVVCAFIFSIHILATDRITKALPPLPVTLAMFVATAAFAIVALPVALAVPGAPSTSDLVALLRNHAFVTPLLFAVFFATILALTLMNLYQRAIDPVRAAILYALEPVWTTIIAMAIGLGRPGTWLFIGGGALVAGNLIAEWGAAHDIKE
ncbi:MAG TPA: DMT family transporter [Candidatus Polarisedimenticolaceae bacterium]|nr:DMT family transporter [Candidatus Polarisedimenticolaceae bacterium]